MSSGQTGSGALIRNTNSLPHGSSPAYASATGAPGVSNTVTIAALASNFTFITGFTVSAQPPSGTNPVGGVVTISDGTWTLYYQFVDTVSAGGFINKELNIPLMSTDVNTAITLTLAAITGGGATAVELRGYYNPAAG